MNDIINIAFIIHHTFFGINHFYWNVFMIIQINVYHPFARVGTNLLCIRWLLIVINPCNIAINETTEKDKSKPLNFRLHVELASPFKEVLKLPITWLNRLNRTLQTSFIYYVYIIGVFFIQLNRIRYWYYVISIY